MTIIIIIALLLSAVVYYYYINFHNIRGQYFSAKGMAEQALASYGKAYERKPNVNNTLNYGYLLLRSGDFNKAEIILNSAFLLSKITEEDKDRVRMMLALLSWKKGDLDEAVAIYEKLFEKGENTTLYANLGFLYIEKGDMEKALQFNRQAYEYNDMNNVIADNFAECCVKTGDSDKAFEVLQRAVTSKMPIAENYYHFSKLLLEKGQYDDAKKYIALAKNMSLNSLSGISSSDLDALETEIDNADR